MTDTIRHRSAESTDPLTVSGVLADVGIPFGNQRTPPYTFPYEYVEPLPSFSGHGDTSAFDHDPLAGAPDWLLEWRQRDAVQRGLGPKTIDWYDRATARATALPSLDLADRVTDVDLHAAVPASTQPRYPADRIEVPHTTRLMLEARAAMRERMAHLATGQAARADLPSVESLMGGRQRIVQSKPSMAERAAAAFTVAGEAATQQADELERERKYFGHPGALEQTRATVAGARDVIAKRLLRLSDHFETSVAAEFPVTDNRHIGTTHNVVVAGKVFAGSINLLARLTGVHPQNFKATWGWIGDAAFELRRRQTETLYSLRNLGVGTTFASSRLAETIGRTERFVRSAASDVAQNVRLRLARSQSAYYAGLHDQLLSLSSVQARTAKRERDLRLDAAAVATLGAIHAWGFLDAMAHHPLATSREVIVGGVKATGSGANRLFHLFNRNISAAEAVSELTFTEAAEEAHARAVLARTLDNLVGEGLLAHYPTTRDEAIWLTPDATDTDEIVAAPIVEEPTRSTQMILAEQLRAVAIEDMAEILDHNLETVAQGQSLLTDKDIPAAERDYALDTAHEILSMIGNWHDTDEAQKALDAIEAADSVMELERVIAYTLIVSGIAARRIPADLDMARAVGNGIYFQYKLGTFDIDPVVLQPSTTDLPSASSVNTAQPITTPTLAAAAYVASPAPAAAETYSPNDVFSAILHTDPSVIADGLNPRVTVDLQATPQLPFEDLMSQEAAKIAAAHRAGEAEWRGSTPSLSTRPASTVGAATNPYLTRAAMKAVGTNNSTSRPASTRLTGNAPVENQATPSRATSYVEGLGDISAQHLDRRTQLREAAVYQMEDAAAAIIRSEGRAGAQTLLEATDREKVLWVTNEMVAEAISLVAQNEPDIWRDTQRFARGRGMTELELVGTLLTRGDRRLRTFDNAHAVADALDHMLPIYGQTARAFTRSVVERAGGLAARGAGMARTTAQRGSAAASRLARETRQTVPAKLARMATGAQTHNFLL